MGGIGAHERLPRFEDTQGCLTTPVEVQIMAFLSGLSAPTETPASVCRVGRPYRRLVLPRPMAAHSKIMDRPSTSDPGEPTASGGVLLEASV